MASDTPFRYHPSTGFMDFRAARNWSPPEQTSVIRVVDAHAAGEPLRVIIGGVPELRGDTVLERRRFARENADRVRTALMWEPRGHADMYGCWIGPPERPDSDFSVLFLHNAGYSTMCGHGIIAVSTVVVETGIVSIGYGSSVRLRIDTPAGVVVADAYLSETSSRPRVESVSFRNVASFVAATDVEVRTRKFGRVRGDLAYGGAFYAFVDAAELGLGTEPGNVAELIEAGRILKKAFEASHPVEHPDHTDLGFLYGVIFTGEAADTSHHSRHVCVFADGEVDRSPTGTGVSARAALLHAAGELEVGHSIRIESIIGSTFDVRVAGRGRLGDREAIVPVVSGRAFITGRSEFIMDPEDGLAHGFLLR